jgi:hypothetical protein
MKSDGQACCAENAIHKTWSSKDQGVETKFIPTE